MGLGRSAEGRLDKAVGQPGEDQASDDGGQDFPALQVPQQREDLTEPQARTVEEITGPLVRELYS